MDSRIPSAPVMRIIREEMAEADVDHTRMEWIKGLAESAGICWSGLHSQVLGKRQTIRFNDADKLFCALGLGCIPWQLDPELNEIYTNVRLDFPKARKKRKRPTGKCNHGHEWNEKNTGYKNTGERYCKECNRIACRRRWHENNQEKVAA